MYLSFDPGLTTGWASFNNDGTVRAMGQASLDELMDLCADWSLQEEEIVAVIYEDWLLYKHKAPKLVGSRMEASQAIGIIKAMAKRKNATLVRQPANILRQVEQWTQIFPPKDHRQSHQIDAFNHGAGYLIQQGLRRTALEEEQDGKPV